MTEAQAEVLRNHRQRIAAIAAKERRSVSRLGKLNTSLIAATSLTATLGISADDRRQARKELVKSIIDRLTTAIEEGLNDESE